MKKISYIICAAAAILAVSCAKDAQPVVENNEAGLVLKTFTADSGAETKTVLVDGKKVHWTEGDQVSVFDDVQGVNGAFAVENIDGANAGFTGYTYENATEYVAVYPYRYGHTYAKDTKTLTISFPQVQKAKAGSFDTDLNLAVAVSDGDHFSFKNVCALMKVTIPSDMTNITTISLANESARMSGKLTVKLNDDGTFVVADYIQDGNDKVQDTDASREVSLSNGGKSLTPGDYYFVVMPGTYKKMFMSVVTADGELYAKYSGKSEYEISSNQVVDFGDVPTAGSKAFKLTDVPTGPVSLEDNYTLGYVVTDADYLGNDLTFENKQKNVVASVPSNVTGLSEEEGTFEIKFGKRPGPGIVDVLYAGVRYPVVFDVRPWYRDEPADWALATTDATMSEVKTSAQGEKYVEITSNTGGHANIKRSSKPWISPAMAPIVCIRITDVADEGYSSSIKFDCSNFKFNNVTFAGELGGSASDGGNRKAINIYSLSDGSKVLVYDLSSQPIKGKDIPSDFLADGNVTFKICDFKKDGSAAQATYKFFWFRTFGSIADLESYLASWASTTGLTYTKTK